MKKIVLFIIVLIFIGCTPNNALRYFDRDLTYSENLRFTKKIDFIEDEKVDTIVYVSYLNGFAKEYNKKEYFLVGIFAPERDYYINTDFDFSLNSSNDFEYYEFNKKYDMNMFNSIELKNSWAKYYIISFEEKSDIYKLDFKVDNKILGKSFTLTFQK